MILRAFLRCLKISFEAKEIKSIKSQFPDVQFRSHEFEIKEMLDQARRRHDEYKKHLNDLKRATKLSDLFETYTPVDITLDEIGKRIAHQIKGLCRKYPVEQRGKTNLLFYFNLHDTFFDPAEQVGRILLQSENWQSVSVVGSSWGYVFASSIQAPQYIKKNVGSFRCQENIWDWLDDLRFKRLAANI